LLALLTVMKGLPLTYNRDLQEDKESVFDAADTLEAALAVLAKMFPAIRVNADRMLEAVNEGFLEATDLADYLVARGLAFREAHETVGNIVRHCIEHNKRLTALALEELRAFSAHFDADVLARLEPRDVIAARDHLGGTAPNRVRAALDEAKRSLGR